MPINIKEKDILVDNVISRLKEVLPETTDFTNGSVLRTIIESLMEEVDIQYWQLEKAYESGFLDYSFGEDLEKLVSLLGVTRNPALKSKGKVIFYRTTPAPSNYFIPSGTLVQTLPDKKGKTFQFQTTQDVTLLTDDLEVEAPIEAITPGSSGNITANTIKTINNPPIGIESVKNLESTSGGMDIETDVALRNRTKHVLDAAGLGTVDALLNKIKSISGVLQVSIVDMARGIGTVNVLVLTDSIPITTIKRQEIEDVIKTTKSGGIDILLLEPTVINVDVHIVLTMLEGYEPELIYETVENAVKHYINELDIGEKLILNQLRKYVLNSNDKIADIDIVTPTGNINITSNEILRTGEITIE